MKLKYMVLEGSKRLLAGGTRAFEFNPRSNEIVVIGTNGTGKSTILLAWTPLPHPSKEFIKGGRKETHWEHKGSYYKCISLYNGGGGTHSIIKDDIVLMENGTASVMTQLIKDHFNIDKDLHDIMTGRKRLSTMSTIERRDWIMRISGGDFSFVMDLFGVMSGKLRDTLGAIRHNRSRLIELEKDRVSDAVMSSYKINLDDINKTLGHVIDIKTKINTIGDCDSVETIENTLSLYGDKYNKVLKAVSCAISDLLAFGVDLHSYIDRAPILRSEATIHQNNLNILLEDLSKIKEQEELVKEAQTITLLKEEYSTLTSTLEKIIINLDIMDDIEDAKLTLINFNQISGTLNVIFSQWNYGEFNNLKDNEFQQLKESRLNNENAVIQLERKIRDLQHRLQHIRLTDDTKCPKCAHHWKIGVVPDEETHVVNTLNASNALLIELKDKVSHLTERINALSNFIEVHNEWRSLNRSNPALNSLWLTINKSNCLSNPDVSLKFVIDNWVSAVTTKILHADLTKQKNIVAEKIEFIESLNIDSNTLSSYKVNIENKISESYKTLDNISFLLKNNERVNLAIKKIRDSEAMIKEDMLIIAKQTQDLVARKSLQVFENVNQELNREAYQINSLLIKSQNSYAVLNELQKSLDDLTETHMAFSVLVSELSPKEGFVAELLTAFIHQLLKDMNNVISVLWTHDLEILPCNKSVGELDFKFPLLIKGNAGGEDVAEGSSAQVDVIDFAFKYVVAQYLELSDYPFLLDELAPTFDEQHRRNIMHFIRQLVDTSVCSQMVMISHYSETHSSFVKAEYIVTDTTNITLPNEYNINATFTL